MVRAKTTSASVPAVRTGVQSCIALRFRPTPRVALLTIAALVGVSRAAVAQEPPALSVVGMVRTVALDPTTYAPALIAYDSTVRDWDTSQVFFAHGFHERNERFTVSGLPNDVPVSYDAGRRRILGDALVTLRTSVANNVTSHLVERLLARRYPQRTKLLKSVGWIERASVASYMSYRLSAKHYRQAQYNDAFAARLGFR
jgi:hypothetical protein